MIPSNISEEHIYLAIQEIDQSGYLEKHESKKYDLILWQILSANYKKNLGN